MWKKIKLLSIGAAVMLLMLSAQAVMAKVDVPPALQRQLRDYTQTYSSQLTTFGTYMASLNGGVPPENLPPEIYSLITTLGQAMASILQPYQQGGVFPGVNGYWHTTQAGHPNSPGAVPGLTYNGYCVALNSFITACVCFIVNLGLAPEVTIACIVAILWYLFHQTMPNNILVSIGSILLFKWNLFYDWIMNPQNWGNYGLAWYFFIPTTPWFPLFEQWVQPSSFTPTWKHPEFTWTS